MDYRPNVFLGGTPAQGQTKSLSLSQGKAFAQRIKCLKNCLGSCLGRSPTREASEEVAELTLLPGNQNRDGREDR